MSLFSPLAAFALLVVTLGGLGSSLRADSPSQELSPTPTYNRDVLPILAEYCFACHGSDSGSREAGLRLDLRDAALEMNAIVPQDAEASELVARIFASDADVVMPPPETKKQLSEDEKQTLREWIADGAEYESHWSFITPEMPQVPDVEPDRWVKNPIDNFVLARLQEASLRPAPEADAYTLFRRLHLDLTGLPPNAFNARAFAEAYSTQPDATLSLWIDRLMNSPAWGEHRGRYWLDAARYADTHGLHFDNYREMWPYRDWVIQAFNKNMPFDQFTVEQIAGDLLPTPSDDQLIATGFQRCNITTNEGGTIDEENMALYAADRVQTLGWVYLGLTTNCSQCHDHKFDPITIRDYYSMAAFFRNTTQPPKDGNSKDGRGPVLVVPSVEDRPRWKLLPSEIAAAKQRLAQHRPQAEMAFAQWRSSVAAESLAAGDVRRGLIVQALLNRPSTETPSTETPTSVEAGRAGGEVTESTVSRIALSVGVSAEVTRPLEIPTPDKLTWNDAGKLGPAPVFRSGQTLKLGDFGDFQANQAFSFGGWIKAGKQNNSGAILSRMNTAQDYRGWDLWQEGQLLGVHIIEAWPHKALKVTTKTPVLSLDQWQHVFATYDGSGTPAGVKLYVDGQLQTLETKNDTLQVSSDIRTDSPLRIGERTGGQQFVDGSAQDVRVYARELSAEDVATIRDSESLSYLLTQSGEAADAALLEYFLVRIDAEHQSLAARIATLEGERAAIESRSPITHIQEERRDTPAMAHILLRGEYDQLGDEVLAATPPALHPFPSDAPANRLGLAKWIIDPANPLTARVTVNRFWQEIFGRGIVVTPEDFGIMGSPPTHPELLDWLSLEFQRGGWDVKQLFKLILSSATYRQAAMMTPEKIELDRDNALLSRGPRFRLDAEVVRDSMLAASGLLSSKMGGPGVKPYQPEAIWDVVGLPSGDTRDYRQDKGAALYRRSLYSFWKRMAPPPNLEAFNAPSREVCTIQRERTNTPLQALVTLNDPQFVEAARCLAENVLQSSGQADAAIVEEIGWRALARPLSPNEKAVLLGSKDELLDHYSQAKSDAEALIGVGDRPTSESLEPAELAAWTMVCNQVLNLDEVLNK